MLLGSRRAIKVQLQGLCLVHLASLTALILPSSSTLTLSTVSAHSKVYCTDAVVLANQIVGCRAHSSPLSRTVHMWGDSPTSPAIPKGWKDSLPKMIDGQCLLSDATVLHIRNLTTGYMPHVSQMALVEPGGKIVIDWSLNGHGGPNYVFREPSRATFTASTPEPSFAEWTDPKHLIAKFDYRTSGNVADPPAALGGTRCNKVPTGGYGGLSPLGQLLQQNGGDVSGSSESTTCFGTVTIPNDMPTGINRLLYYWHHPPNDANFFDAFYINVQPAAAALRQATPLAVEDYLEMQTSPTAAETFQRTIPTNKVNPQRSLHQAYLSQVVVPLVYRAPGARQLLLEIRNATQSGELIGTYKRPLYPSMDGRVTIIASIGIVPELTELTVSIKMLDQQNQVKTQLPNLLRTTVTDNTAIIGQLRAAQDQADRESESAQVKALHAQSKATEAAVRLQAKTALEAKLSTLEGDALKSAQQMGQLQAALDARYAALARAQSASVHATLFSEFLVKMNATSIKAQIDLTTQPARTIAAALQYDKALLTMPTLANLTQHTRPGIDCWTLIGGRMLDLTQFSAQHAGGALVLSSLCATDATTKFVAQHMSVYFVNQVIADGDVKEIELRPTAAQITSIKNANIITGRNALSAAQRDVVTAQKAIVDFMPLYQQAISLKNTTQIEAQQAQELYDSLWAAMPKSSSSSSQSTAGAPLDTHQVDADDIAQAKQGSSSTGPAMLGQSKSTISPAASRSHQVNFFVLLAILPVVAMIASI